MALLAALQAAYAEWQPADAPTLSGSPASPSGARCSHPVPLLRELSRALEAAAEGGPGGETSSLLTPLLASLHLLCRSPLNRHELCALGLSSALTRLLRWPQPSAEALRLLVQLLEAQPSSRALTALLPLDALEVTPLEASSGPLGLSSAPSLQSRTALCAARTGLDAGLAAALLPLLDDTRCCPLAAQALSSLLCALEPSTASSAAAALREAGGIESLLERVGAPPAGGAEGAGAEEVRISTLRRQLLSLELSALICIHDRDALRRARSAGMFSVHLTQLLRWAGSAWAPQGQQSVAPSVPPPLLLLFSVLRRLCAGLTEEVGTGRALAERTLVCVALSVGGAEGEPSGSPSSASGSMLSSSPRSPSVPKWPSLQLLSFSFLTQCVRSAPLAVAALR